MNIHFFGSSLVSSYWNGAATYYRGLLKALSRLGNDVTFYEPAAYDRQQHRDMDDPEWARVVVYPATPAGWQDALAKAQSKADLLVKASGVGVFDRELEAAVLEAARPGTMVIYWDVDAPATLEAMESDAAHHLRDLIPRYDLVLTYGGHAPVVEGYRRWGARDCVPVYNALDPETHFPVAASELYRSHLSFLGNRLPDREARVEAFFLKAAALKPEKHFLLGGSGWEGKPVPANVALRGHVGTGDHNAFYCSSLATLNINRDSMARFGFSPPTRIFEAAGAGACIISDRWQGMELFLEPGDEVLIAEDGAEVSDLLGRLTARRSQEIGRAARARILAEHTYQHRAMQVARILDMAPRKHEAAA